MSDNVAAVALVWGRIRLVIGTEVGVTAMEIVTDGDLTRLDLNDLTGIAHQLGGADGISSDWEATVVVDKGSDETAAQDIEVRTYGPDDSALATAVAGLDPEIKQGIVAEAAIAAWRQRLADAADSLDPLTIADAKIIGPLSLPGSPLITELRADRRRALGNPARSADDIGDVLTSVDNASADFRAAVRFGAAGLADASDDLLAESVQSACADGGWLDRLRLLIAAEEIYATELMMAVGTLLTGAGESRPEGIDRLMSKYAAHRQHAEDLARLLADVLDRLPAGPGNLAQKLLKRKVIRDVRVVRDTVETYSRIVSSVSPDGEEATWNDAALALVAIDAAASSDEDDDQQHTESVEEAAKALGELFERALPEAQKIVDDINRQHPDSDVDTRVQIVKRQALRKLAVAPRHEDSGHLVQETVAELAMAIALLRRIKPRTTAEFREAGLRMIARADKIAGLQEQAGVAMPMVSTAFSEFMWHALPRMVEFVFHSMSGLKPARPGTARDAYKFARSKVWGARHDRRVADAAADRATEAVQKFIDGAGPRLIVRHVDRVMRVPKR